MIASIRNLLNSIFEVINLSSNVVQLIDQEGLPHHLNHDLHLSASQSSQLFTCLSRLISGIFYLIAHKLFGITNLEVASVLASGEYASKRILPTFLPSSSFHSRSYTIHIG